MKCVSECVFPSNSRMRAAQKCARKHIPLPPCRAVRKACASCVNHRMAVDAWSARFAKCAAR
eukprot:10042002-Lingulodinium_polyedra.AAC.1